MRKTLNYALSLAVFVLPFAAVTAFNATVANAAAVTLSVTPLEVATSDATDETLSFVPATAHANGATITVLYDADIDDTGFTGAGVSVTKTGDANLTSAAAVVDTAANTITITLTTAGALDTTNAFDIVITGTNFVAPATQQSMSYSVTTSAGDFGAALQYVGDDNDVTVTAIIGPTLSFNIRTLDDSADTNVCDMGAVDTTSQPNGDAVVDAGEGECGYSLAVATNAANGFTTTIREQGDFTNGTHNMADQADDAAFVAGTEGYGLDFVGVGTALTNTTEAGTFATDSSPLPATDTNFITATAGEDYVAGTDATDVTQVIHGLAVGAATPTGVYSQTVTFLTTASF